MAYLEKKKSEDFGNLSNLLALHKDGKLTHRLGLESNLSNDITNEDISKFSEDLNESFKKKLTKRVKQMLYNIIKSTSVMCGSMAILITKNDNSEIIGFKIKDKISE